MRRGGLGALIVAVVVSATALGTTPAGAIVPPEGLFQPVAPAYGTLTLTRDWPDTFAMRATDRKVIVTAPAHNAHQNGRGVFWPRSQGLSTNQQSCVTLVSRRGLFVQQGLALRIARLTNGAVRAITVTYHVYANPQNLPLWVFNVHLWRSDREPAFQLLATYDLGGALMENGTARPFPWRLCARVQGRRLKFRAWVEAESPPAWSDPTHGASLVLPGGNRYPGLAGWYVGHLAAGGRAIFRDPVSGEHTAGPG
jgi:hypothetical protein